MPKVSVIIPVYGVEKYIERCARRLFEQTLDDIEYLFIDDCTLDNSVSILKSVLEDYPQRKSEVIIHRMEKNSGQAEVRKWGMLHASGDFVIHCDSDDWVECDMYRLMYEKANEVDADIVVCDYVVHDGKNSLKIVKGAYNSEIHDFLQRFFLCNDQWSLWNKLIRRNDYFYELFYPKGNMGEDMAIMSQVLLHCRKMAYIPTPYYFYFNNSDSITKKLTIQSVLKNFESMKANTDLVLSQYKSFKDSSTKTGLLYIQYNVKSYLFPVLHKKELRSLFIATYPHLLLKMLFDFHFPRRLIFKYLSSLFGLYPRKVRE